MAPRARLGIKPTGTVYPACQHDSLELCQLEEGSGKIANSSLIDAHLRTCRSEGELFAAAVNTTQADRCLSFEDLVSLPNTQWAGVWLPEAFVAYPMDVDLQSILLAYFYGLRLNIVSAFSLPLSTTF
ncbi:unnamed protein product [Dibothriocephalus latus]|uniref:Uncharacterized protein n=1 Tax=Dibothriocephalus latus TaxID=60516 RepID=A0A3P7MYR0_DIBLA|nr:unnamed protein product [Dibothriocephalus latus]